jgi:hypothetical protein
VNRRGFVKKGLFGGALLVLGGGSGLWLFPSRAVARPTRALAVLDEPAFQVVCAIAARVVPLDDADPAAIAHGVDEALARAPVEAQRDLKRLLGLFENALPGLLLDGRTAPFTRLGPAAQDRVLESWRDSRLVLRRGGYNALRKLCLAAYYVDPRTWKALRYIGPPGVGGFSFDDSKAGTAAWKAEQDAKRGAP